MPFTPIQTKVFDFLSRFRSPRTGECTPYLKEIAAAAGVSRGYVSRVVGQLSALGVIDVEERWEVTQGESAPHREANLYRINHQEVLRCLHNMRKRWWKEHPLIHFAAVEAA